MNYVKFLISLVVVVLLFGLLFFVYITMRHFNNPSVRYLPLGDSYTIGTSVDEAETWPVLLVNHLRESGVDVELVMNPARLGFTTQDMIDRELPYVDSEQADFVTVLIGVNDWVQGVSADVFRQRFGFILDELLKRSSNDHIVAVTIPDFSLMPQGPLYSQGRDISKGIQEFNGIILDESRKRNIATVDVFSVSQLVKDDSSLIAIDGLHPSGKQYKLWEGEIFPVVLKLLKK